MNPQFIILPAVVDRTRLIERIGLLLTNLPMGEAFQLELSEYKDKRTQQQNKYLWSVCYPTVLERGGEALRGWTKDDLHEYFLGECYGWEVLTGFGKKRHRPIRRSSRMSREVFGEYLDFIQRECAQKMGIFIPDADPQWKSKAKEAQAA